jgi:hypothetical protein
MKRRKKIHRRKNIIQFYFTGSGNHTINIILNNPLKRRNGKMKVARKDWKKLSVRAEDLKNTIRE